MTTIGQKRSKPKPRAKHPLRHLSASSVLAGLSLALLFSLAPTVESLAQQTLQEKIYQARNRVLPALVHIQPVVADYRTGKLQKQSVVGSGVIIHPDGYVVTNYHVAGKAERILCTLADKEQVPAILIGGDPPTDLAVIKLDLSEYHGTLIAAEFGDSDALQVGQQVIAMGSPLALARSITFGVISTLDRYFPDDTRLPSGEKTGQYNLWLQTDAAINPGNSGGPLVDLQGQVVGINSRASVFANNIGFSIPSNIVRAVSAQLIENGSVERSWIGISIQPLQDLEDWFGSEDKHGALISSVDPGSPADRAKLRAGDVITSINGSAVSARFVEEIPAVHRNIADYQPGSELRIIVRRGDESFSIVTITEKLGRLLGDDQESPEWGCAVRAITKQMALDYQLTSLEGVFVTGVQRPGPAYAAGLRSGDVIVKVDGQIIESMEDFTGAYNAVEFADSTEALLVVRRGAATRFALIKTDPKTTDSTDSANSADSADGKADDQGGGE